MSALRSVVLALALTTASLGAPPAAAQGDNTAVAVNTHDGMDMFRLAFRVTRVMSDTVDTGNAAAAVSSCTGCETVAIAVQVVLVLSDPTVVSPENLALALNVECTLCETLASAYQMVLTTGGPVHFTADGNKHLADIRRRLLELRFSEASVEEMAAQVRTLTAELAQVVRTELVPAGSADPGGQRPAESTTTSSPAPPTSTTQAGATSSTSSTTATTSPTSSTSSSSTSTTATTSTTVAATPTT